VSRQQWLASLGAIATAAGLTLVGSGGPAAASPRPQYAQLAGSVAPFARTSLAIGPVPAAMRLSVEIWLSPNLAGAQRYAAAVSTPGNRLFHHYLSPDAFTTRFGPSQAQAARVASWLRGQGFSAVQSDAQRNYVQATAATSTIDKAFRVQLKNYRPSAGVTGGRYPLYANDRPVTLPASLASSVLGVTGLDNAAVEDPLLQPGATAHSPAEALAAKDAAKIRLAPCSHYYGQHYATGLPRQFGTTKFPTVVCGYSAHQLRGAYGASFNATGKGQTVALIELGLAPAMFLTLKDYAQHNGMPAPSRSRYSQLSLGRGTACGDFFFLEEQLDVEAAYDMAPGAHELVVGGDSCNNGNAGLQGLFNADLKVLDGSGHHPLATIVSNSWEGATEEQPPANTRIETSFLLRAAGEGVGMYFSSGDGSGVLSPSDNPNAIAVGGTTLGIGQHGNRLFETGWSTGQSLLTVHRGWAFVGEQGAAGGGPSILWAQPSYQQGVVPARFSTPQGDRTGPVRSVPDISADADPFTGIAVGLVSLPSNPSQKPVYFQLDVGGTSESAPLVAGMVAAAQQGQPQPFGFINPVLYRLLGSAALHQPMRVNGHSPAEFRGAVCSVLLCGIETLSTFDDQVTHMFGYFGQVDTPGYNNITGVGTPHGQVFIRDLRALAG
jgi:subtilase family serine protease